MTDTMTMDHDTMPDTKSCHVVINVETLVSINSIMNFGDTSANPTAQALAGVSLVRDGESVLRVYATNRYVLARATYFNSVNFDSWDVGEKLWLDHKTLKQAVAIAKNHKQAVITIGYDTDRRVFVDVDGNKLFNVLGQPSYPNVAAMFDDDTTPNGADVIRINPRWLALLSKVITPTTRQNKDLPWVLSFFHDTESKKPKPMLATLEDTDWNISVLIQPNLIVR
jgi:hypothetical protein